MKTGFHLRLQFCKGQDSCSELTNARDTGRHLVFFLLRGEVGTGLSGLWLPAFLQKQLQVGREKTTVLAAFSTRP